MLKAPKKQISNPEGFKLQVGDQKLDTIEDLYRQGQVQMVVKVLQSSGRLTSPRLSDHTAYFFWFILKYTCLIYTHVETIRKSISKQETAKMPAPLSSFTKCDVFICIERRIEIS